MNYRVFWNGEEKNIIFANVNEPCYNSFVQQEIALFSVKTQGKLVITSEAEVNSAIIRPLSLGIKPTISDRHTITVELKGAAKFSLEVNGSHHGNLLVFASEYRKEPECPPDGKKIRFTPGTHYIGSYNVSEDNTVIIVEEGAVLYGDIVVSNAKNITLCGHGIITKAPFEYGKCDERLLSFDRCRNVNIFDVTLIDSIGWTCVPSNCDNVHVDNINIIGCRGNTDGIDVCGCRNVLVERVFTRTWDDSFVIKAFESDIVENLEFRDSTLWNDFARPMEIGVELRTERVKNISFKNIDVIHSMTGYPIMGIHHGDRAKVSDILMDDIRLEDINGGQIFDIRITDSIWNKDPVKNGIENVTIRNIAVVEPQKIIPSKSRLSGYDASASIKNVTLENFSFCGRFAKSLDECQVDIYDFVEAVTYKAPDNVPTLNRISSAIDFIEEPFMGTDGYYHATVRLTLTNEGDAYEDGYCRLHISPVNTAFYDGNERYFSLKPQAVYSEDFDVCFMSGKYVIDVQSEAPCVEYTFRYIALDAHISNDIENAVPYTFNNYYGERTENFKLAASETELILESPVDDDIIVYTALPVKPAEGEVLFTVEETDFGIAPAVTLCKGKPVAAPQLRCPAEITYVFLNWPKVEKINQYTVKNPKGVVKISFSELGLPENCKNFLLEVVLCTRSSGSRRYPYSLFHSVRPEEIAHMFANVMVD